MKKLVNLMLCILLVLACTCAFAEEDFSGTWYVVAISVGDVSFPATALGRDVALTLNADGTSESNLYGNEVAGTWSADGTTISLTTGDHTEELTYHEDTGLLTHETRDGVSLTFSRDAAASLFTKDEPAEVYAEDIAAFDGTWTPVHISIGGVYVDMETAMIVDHSIGDMEGITLEISNGSLTVEGKTFPLSLVDGLLFGETGAPGNNFTFSLLEGDLLRMDTSVSPCSVILARAE